MQRGGLRSRRCGRAAMVAAALASVLVVAGCGQKTANLKVADQKICAAQAEHVFVTNGWSLTGAVTRIGNVESAGAFTSHYNVRERKCFMELLSHAVDTASLMSTNSAVLSD